MEKTEKSKDHVWGGGVRNHQGAQKSGAPHGAGENGNTSFDSSVSPLQAGTVLLDFGSPRMSTVRSR